VQLSSETIAIPLNSIDPRRFSVSSALFEVVITEHSRPVATLVCNLETLMERPELREFQKPTIRHEPQPNGGGDEKKSGRLETKARRRSG
jgi:hypothetical protein